MNDFDSEVSANFVAITGATVEEARNWLEIGGFVLEDAVNLYFSSKSNDVAQQDGPRTQRGESFDFDQDEDGVRRPDEVKRRRLLEFDYERINSKFVLKVMVVSLTLNRHWQDTSSFVCL